MKWNLIKFHPRIYFSPVVCPGNTESERKVELQVPTAAMTAKSTARLARFSGLLDLSPLIPSKERLQPAVNVINIWLATEPIMSGELPLDLHVFVDVNPLSLQSFTHGRSVQTLT